MNENQDGLRQAVNRLLDALDGGPSLDEPTWNLILASLTRIVRSRTRGPSHDDLVDAASASVTSFIQAYRDGRVDRQLNPTGYMVQIAQNEAASLQRRLRREQETRLTREADVAEDDAQLERLIEELAGDERVRELLESAKAAGKHELASFVRVFLDLAQDETPTFSLLAASLDVSRATVHARFQALRELIEESNG